MAVMFEICIHLPILRRMKIAVNGVCCSTLRCRSASLKMRDEITKDKFSYELSDTVVRFGERDLNPEPGLCSGVVGGGWWWLVGSTVS